MHGDPLDYADLFARLYDEVDADAFRRSAERWLDDPAVTVLARRTSGDAGAGDLTAAFVHDAVARDGERGRLGVLLGLDRAFAQAGRRGLDGYATRYRERGRLDSGRVAGAVLPRFVRPGRAAQLPSDLRDAFEALVRVPAQDWARTDHVSLSVPPPEGPLVVGTTPLVADPAELRWEVRRRNGRRFYRLYPADAAATRRRIRQIVAGFDAGGVHLGMAPEATLSPALLAEWQRALRERPAAEHSPLRLVLAGSGNVDGDDPPANTAVLLDARTGEVVLRQRKLFRFSLYGEDIDRWRLHARFGREPIDEDLEPGERLTILETGWARLAVLVCEDLARVPALAQPLLSHGVSLILAPVFSRPTKERRWEHVHALGYADSTGSTIVAANSLVMASVLGTELPAGAAIAVSPGGATLATAASAADVVRYELVPGAAPRLLPTAAAREHEQAAQRTRRRLRVFVPRVEQPFRRPQALPQAAAAS